MSDETWFILCQIGGVIGVIMLSTARNYRTSTMNEGDEKEGCGVGGILAVVAIVLVLMAIIAAFNPPN